MMSLQLAPFTAGYTIVFLSDLEELNNTPPLDAFIFYNWYLDYNYFLTCIIGI